MILHTVALRLKHPEGSPEEKAFLDAAQALAELPMVQNFQRLRQVSQKNDFRFGLSMEFADQAAYDAYNSHPAHVAFIADRWMKEVADFMEIDYLGL